MYQLTVPSPNQLRQQQQKLQQQQHINHQIQQLKITKNTFSDIQDLQLAAELGRTLLERNEELENELKQQQAIIEDQGQEIEFLTKQSTSMKEQSENRAKFYEQLEQTIIELERTNTHLSRDSEIDKKRIQSLCENIDFLERKCEEMSRALEALRDERAKRGFHGSRGKVNRGSYFNCGSDSSEEDNMTSGYGFGYGYGFLRRRSHSLQDLRDYTPSPDEFDSGNSNSPDLKNSESEYVESLETRIEELTTARKSETDKVHELESQMRILIQENANLQTQLVQTSSEKDEQIAELRRQLLDSGNYSQISFNSSAILATSTRRNSSEGDSSRRLTHLEHEMELASSTLAILSPASPSNSSSSANSSSPHSPRASSSSNLGDAEGSSSSSVSSTSMPTRRKSHLNPLEILNINNGSNNNMLMCKRCSAEVSILSLVNSIEVENDNDVNGGCYADFTYNVAGFTGDDHDIEFSSLEHELARATGASMPFDNRHNNTKRSPNRNMNRTFPLFPRHRSSIFQRDKSSRSDGSDSNNEIQLEGEQELEYDENFELFLGHQPRFTGSDERAASSASAGNDSKQGRRVFIMEESSDPGACSGSSSIDNDEEDDEHVDLDEEPCLTKDRKPEISRSKKNSGRNSFSKKPSKKSSGIGGNGGSGRGLDKEDSCLPVNQEAPDPGCQKDNPLTEAIENLNITFTSRYHSKLLELPARIPSDEEDEDDEDDFVYDDDDIVGKGIHAKVPVSSDAAILFKNRFTVEGSTTAVGAAEGELSCEEVGNRQNGKCQNSGEPLKKTKLWWLAWFILVVMGVFQLIWAILSLLFFLVTSTILPGGSKGSSSFANVSSSMKKCIAMTNPTTSTRLIPIPSLSSSTRKL